MLSRFVMMTIPAVNCSTTIVQRRVDGIQPFLKSMMNASVVDQGSHERTLQTYCDDDDDDDDDDKDDCAIETFAFALGPTLHWVSQYTFPYDDEQLQNTITCRHVDWPLASHVLNESRIDFHGRIFPAVVNTEIERWSHIMTALDNTDISETGDAKESWSAVKTAVLDASGKSWRLVGDNNTVNCSTVYLIRALWRWPTPRRLT